jgi:ABC-type ATPase with predicted acetyltransferase domain
VLSNGEQYRAVLARVLRNDICIDEFTSVIDRNAARSLCVALQRHIQRQRIRNVVFASCHADFLPFLQPDWVLLLDPQSHARLIINPNKVHWANHVTHICSHICLCCTLMMGHAYV